MNSKLGFPVFNTVIYANYISKKDKIASDSLTDEDIQVLISNLYVLQYKNMFKWERFYSNHSKYLGYSAIVEGSTDS